MLINPAKNLRLFVSSALIPGGEEPRTEFGRLTSNDYRTRLLGGVLGEPIAKPAFAPVFCFMGGSQSWGLHPKPKRGTYTKDFHRHL
jgi:hypothetical protein